MVSRGHTTVIKRVLERRAAKPRTEEGTTATVAVIVRGLPPPKALIALFDSQLREHLDRHITPDVLDCESVTDEREAVRLFSAEFRPVVLTDSQELIRKLRSRSSVRTPFIVYMADLDDATERAGGLSAGADECVGRRVSDRELDARIHAARRVAELESALRVTLEENRKLSTIDDLTRTASRRFFGKHFPREVERAVRYGRALSVILCDIDHFKTINDTLGHMAGDQTLEQFGSRLRESLRAGIDWVARIGGEEFAIVLPETAYEPARHVASKIRAAVSRTTFKAGKKRIRVTASFGLCGMNHAPVGESRLAQRMLRVADAALYRSKETGRNRVTAAVLKVPGKPMQ
jgi:two-component system cell cycle response regulator